MKISIVTPTGNRPIAFSLCRKYVERQTVKPDQWLIVDDGDIKLDIPDWATYVKRLRKDREPAHTLPLQMVEAIPHITGDYIFIIEDDDWYAPNYLETMLPYLKKFDMVGLDRTVYYHVRLGYIIHAHTQHATFCHTGCTRKILEPLMKISSTIKNPSIDLALWKINCSKFILDSRVSIGIKGLPGRLGTYSHIRGRYKPDAGHRFLESIIGKDVENYAPYFV